MLSEIVHLFQTTVHCLELLEHKYSKVATSLINVLQMT